MQIQHFFRSAEDDGVSCLEIPLKRLGQRSA